MLISKFLRRRTNWSLAVYLMDRLEVPPPGSPHALATTVRLLRGPRHVHTKADPFLFEHLGRLYVFYETQSVDDPGRIEVAEVTKHGLSELGVVLAEPGHLSYPHVFEIDGEIYLIPESQELGEVRLYRFAEFPRRLEFVRTLLRGDHADPSPVRVEGRWYVFTTTAWGLELHHGDDLVAGELVPHPASPITVDPRYSRCAGVPFALDGMLVRPAQNCAVTYGGNVNLMVIETVSPTAYREQLLRADIFSGNKPWNRVGAHHISVARFGDRMAVAVDGQAYDYYIHKLIMRAWMVLSRYRRPSP